VVDRAKAFDALLELTRQLGVERPLNAALRLVSDAALELLAGDHASVRVLDHTRTELLCSARSGAGVDAKPASFSPGHGVIGWVVERGEAARVGDAAGDARFVHKEDQGFAIRSMLAVPLWSAGEVVGVLAVTSPETGAYAEQDEAVATLLANCSVPPIERARLARLAVTDPQTLAFNDTYLGRGLRLEMDRAAGRGAPLSVLVMNLDLFKRVNDTLGTGAGDQVLRRFADLVRATTRDDDVVVRRRGDEFVLLMPGTALEHAFAVGERIRCSLEGKPVELDDGRQVGQTVSVGVASWDGQESPADLERRGAKAVRAAKLHGRNRIQIDRGSG
jgi:two-component system cell cycle response regulator